MKKFNVKIGSLPFFSKEMLKNIDQVGEKSTAEFEEWNKIDTELLKELQNLLDSKNNQFCNWVCVDCLITKNFLAPESGFYVPGLYIYPRRGYIILSFFKKKIEQPPYLSDIDEEKKKKENMENKKYELLGVHALPIRFDDLKDNHPTQQETDFEFKTIDASTYMKKYGAFPLQKPEPYYYDVEQSSTYWIGSYERGIILRLMIQPAYKRTSNTTTTNQKVPCGRNRGSIYCIREMLIIIDQSLLK